MPNPGDATKRSSSVPSADSPAATNSITGQRSPAQRVPTEGANSPNALPNTPLGSGSPMSSGAPPGSAPQGSDVGKVEAGKLDDKSPRERILQASLELFVEQGYFNTNVPDISRRSRCSVGSIYHHFLNKEEIAAQIFDAGMKDFRAALAKAIDLKKSPEENIAAIVVAFMSFAERNHLLARYLWLARHSEFLNQQVKIPTVVGFDELGRRVTVLLRRAENEGSIAKLPAEVIWSILFGLPLSYMRDWLDGYTRMLPSQVAPIIAQACWAALRGLEKEDLEKRPGSTAKAKTEKQPPKRQ